MSRKVIDNFEWIYVNERIVSKLLELESFPCLLSRILKGLFQEQNSKKISYYPGPATIFGWLYGNARINRHSRLKKLKKEFLKQNFNGGLGKGIPLFRANQLNILPNEHWKNYEEKLSQFFFNAIHLADQQDNKTFEREFIRLYDELISIQGVSSCLSSLLFLANPYFYIGLNEKSQILLKAMNKITKELTCPPIYTEPLKQCIMRASIYDSPGTCYLKLCRQLRSNSVFNDSIQTDSQTKKVPTFALFSHLSHKYVSKPKTLEEIRLRIKEATTFTKNEIEQVLYLTDISKQIRLSDESRDVLGLDKKTIAKYRIEQNEFRRKLEKKWESKCVITKFSVREALRASHIKPWAVSTPEERVDEDNGLLLIATLDALFDQHLISFDNEGRIMVSERKLEIKSYFQKMGIDLQKRYFKPSKKMKAYLDFHRKEFKKRLNDE